MRHVLALSFLLPARVAVGCALVALGIASTLVELHRADRRGLWS